MTNTLTLVLAVIGAIGLSQIVASIRFGRRLSRQNRFLRFQAKEPLDIVLTTSERTEGGVGIRYVRPTTALGNLQGATEISRAAGGLAGQRPIRVHLSQDLESPLSGDLVMLGGPSKNEVTALFFSHLRKQYPATTFQFKESDQEGCWMTLGAFSEQYSLQIQTGKETPSRDLAFVAFWINPFSTRKRRAIMCGGFTAYSTAAAAKYLVGDFMNDRYNNVRARFKMPRLWNPRKWPCFLAVLEIRLIHDQVVEVIERAFAPLADPGALPLETPKPENNDPLTVSTEASG